MEKENLTNPGSAVIRSLTFDVSIGRLLQTAFPLSILGKVPLLQR
jgi:hypothetical protein